jgi:hypothetical protein
LGADSEDVSACLNSSEWCQLGVEKGGRHRKDIVVIKNVEIGAEVDGSRD